MSSRTVRIMIAEALGEEIEYRTAGGYSVAGVVRTLNAENGFPCQVVAVGHSWDSVLRRTRAISRKLRRGLHKSDEQYVMEVVHLTEATAPVVREYFGTHRVAVTGWYTEANGWLHGNRYAGRSEIRKMAKEAIGITAVEFSMPLGRNRGHRTADFQMTELLASMNKRTSR